MIRHGYTAAGKQRWRCLSCQRSFVRSGTAYQYARQRVWFERWITEGYSVRQLAQQSGHSPATLRRLITYWLARPPQPALTLASFRYLIIDGTYLQGRQEAVVALADAKQRRIITGWYGIKEGSLVMQQYCAELAAQGLQPDSVTIDGLPAVQAMVSALWPHARLQRCVVHVQRQGLSWCRQSPKRTDARLLRALFQQLGGIATPAERERFWQAWQLWEARYGSAIAGRKESGWIFSDLKRARSMLVKALPFLFNYLDDPDVPTSTNWLEGYFSRLKARYRQHRGLARKHRQNYFLWYFHLCQR